MKYMLLMYANESDAPKINPGRITRPSRRPGMPYGRSGSRRGVAVE